MSVAAIASGARVDAARKFDRAHRLLLACYAGLAAGFAISAIKALADPKGIVAADFSVFATGWWLILHGQGARLYDADAQRAAQHIVMHGAEFQGGLMAFLNPPHAAIAGVPLGWLAERFGERASFLTWTAVNVALLWLFDRWLRETVGAVTGMRRWTATAALLAFYPVFLTIQLGQLSLLLGVAVLGLYRAVEARRPFAGAAWLLVLSAKPQLVLPLVVFLAARRQTRMLTAAAAMGAIAAVASASILGPRIWLDYARHVGELEQFWGSGTPDYMLNVRGALTRMLPLADAHVAASVSYVLAIAASIGLAVALWRLPMAEREDSRAVYVLAVSMALLFSPHLFPQDAVMWAIPAAFVGGAAWLVPIVTAIPNSQNLQFLTFIAVTVTVVLRLRDGA